MKKFLCILFILISTNLISQGLKTKIKSMRFTHDLAPIASYSNRLHLPNNGDTMTVHTIGLGISLANGDFETQHFIVYNWEYIAAPFIKLDLNFANRKGQSQLFTPQDGASPLVLSAGVTGAKGVGLLLPFGVNATAALATDFKDGYFQYGLAWDAVGLSIGIKGMLNFTNSNQSFYKTEAAIEVRYIWGWD